MSDIMYMIICGLAYLVLAPVLGGLIAGADRIITARMQRRVGPPLLQPFYDVMKLRGKETPVPNNVQNFYIGGFLLFVIISGLFFFTGGDILMVIFTLTLAGVCFVIASYSSNSPYAAVGAERELMQTMSYEPMLLTMAIGFYLTCGSFKIDAIINAPYSCIFYMPGIFLGLCYVLLIKFRKSPFDLSMSHEAHQELIQGMVTEISGKTLALVEIAHWYENVFLLGFVYLFFAGGGVLSHVAAFVICLVVYFLDILTANSCARLKWQQMLCSAWLVTLILGFVNIIILMAIL